MGAVYNKIGGANLITKSITSNGTYNAENDNADGYNQVTVNVKAQRVLLWEGANPDGVTIDLSAYKFVYIVVIGGAGVSGSTNCNLLLEVGGAEACAGVIQGASNKARAYSATTSGIVAGSGDQLNVYRVYGITDID